MAKGKKFGFGFRKSAFGLGFGEMSIMMKLALLAVIVIPVIAFALMMGSKTSTPSTPISTPSTPISTPSPTPSGQSTIATAAGPAPSISQFAVVKNNTINITNDLSNSSLYKTVQGKTFPITQILKLQNGAGYAVLVNGYIFTTPTLDTTSTPEWKQVGGNIAVVSKLLQLKDGSFAVIMASGISIFKSLTNPVWSPVWWGGKIISGVIDMIQCKDDSFAVVFAGGSIFLTPTLSNPAFVVSYGTSGVFKIYECNENNKTVFIAIIAGGQLFMTPSLATPSWKLVPGGSAGIGDLLQLQNGKFAVVTTAGIATSDAISSPVWTFIPNTEGATQIITI